MLGWRSCVWFMTVWTGGGSEIRWSGKKEEPYWKGWHWGPFPCVCSQPLWRVPTLPALSRKFNSVTSPALRDKRNMPLTEWRGKGRLGTRAWCLVSLLFETVNVVTNIVLFCIATVIIGVPDWGLLRQPQSSVFLHESYSSDPFFKLKSLGLIT